MSRTFSLAETDHLMKPYHSLLVTFAIAFALVSASFVASAAQRIVVNEAKILVEDQSSRAQQKAAKQALREVFLKMSGSTDSLSNPGVKAALSSPQSLLRSYRYSYEGNQTYYVAEFDTAKVGEILQREMLPLWGDRRPETLIWLAVQDNNENKRIIDESLDFPIAAALRATAKERGIPISLPLMDLTDNVNITTYDVWGRFVEPVREASRRYSVDNIIAARVYKNDSSFVPDLPNAEVVADFNSNNYLDNETSAQSKSVADQTVNSEEFLEEANYESDSQDEQTDVSRTGTNDGMSERSENAVKPGLTPFTMDEFEAYANRSEEGDFGLDWVFISNDSVSYGSIYDDSPASLGNALADAYADYLSSQYAVVGISNANRETLEISVANVGTIESYANLSRYLRTLSVIESANLKAQRGTVATFSITLIGTTEDLMNTVGLEAKLRPVTDAYGQPMEGFSFYWNN
ncbi:DUF2066 domain-containing protein [Alteromonas sp. A081]|uniref:DUF2066 domain-containing protein n=1 Tax=Alteromonas sp. A081 TaxID=3410269 RepID=UPI003B984FE8